MYLHNHRNHNNKKSKQGEDVSINFIRIHTGISWDNLEEHDSSELDDSGSDDSESDSSSDARKLGRKKTKKCLDSDSNSTSSSNNSDDEDQDSEGVSDSAGNMNTKVHSSSFVCWANITEILGVAIQEDCEEGRQADCYQGEDIKRNEDQEKDVCSQEGCQKGAQEDTGDLWAWTDSGRYAGSDKNPKDDEEPTRPQEKSPRRKTETWCTISLFLW
jgi:hypothetical protein